MMRWPWCRKPAIIIDDGRFVVYTEKGVTDKQRDEIVRIWNEGTEKTMIVRPLDDLGIDRDGPPVPFVPASPAECTCVDPWSNCPTHG